MGTGQEASFWHDNWFTGDALKHNFQTLFHLSEDQSISVSGFLNKVRNGNANIFVLTQRGRQEFQDMMNLLNQTIISLEDDMVKWK